MHEHWKIHPHVIRVFEHQELNLEQTGAFQDRHFRAMVRFARLNGERYFKVTHNGIRFRQFVGAIQVGSLVIEILPKADRETPGDTGKWHAILLDVLRECGLLNEKHFFPAASLQTRPLSLMELYLNWFLDEVEQLLRQGLEKSYRSVQRNIKVKKGRLLPARQIAHNLIHQERFFVACQEYDFFHPFNRLIGRALQVMGRMDLAPFLRARWQSVWHHFPVLENDVSMSAPDNYWIFRPAYDRYRSALQLADLLLRQAGPDLQAGEVPLQAFLFDMNRLFEELIYRQLIKASNSHIQVRRQESRPFWSGRYLRPDILLIRDGENVVIDTKWKILTSLGPAMDDLRQVFAYSQLFNAPKAVLLYPKVYDLPDMAPAPFHVHRQESPEYTCQVHFIRPFREDGRLNRHLGEAIMRWIFPGH